MSRKLHSRKRDKNSRNIKGIALAARVDVAGFLTLPLPPLASPSRDCHQLA